MNKVSNLEHMNAKVDVLYQKLDNLIITYAVNTISVTPNYKIYGVLDHIGVECQLFVELVPN